MHNKNLLGVLALVTATIVWGGSVVAQKMALQNWHPSFVLLVRGGGTLLLIVPWLVLKNQIDRSVIFKDRAMLTALGFFGVANSLFVLLGLQFTSAMEAGMMMGSSPILTALLLKLMGRKTLDRRGWAAAVITFLGVILVVFHPESGGAKITMAWLGNFLVFLGVVCWSAYTVFSKEAMLRHSPFLIMAVTWVGVLLVVPITIHQQRISSDNLLLGWGALIYIVVIATVLAFFLWLYGLHQMGEARSSVFLNLIPLFSIVFSASLLGESIHLRQWIGGGLILFGAWTVSGIRPGMSRTEK